MSLHLFINLRKRRKRRTRIRRKRKRKKSLIHFKKSLSLILILNIKIKFKKVKRRDLIEMTAIAENILRDRTKKKRKVLENMIHVLERTGILMTMIIINVTNMTIMGVE